MEATEKDQSNVKDTVDLNIAKAMQVVMYAMSKVEVEMNQTASQQLTLGAEAIKFLSTGDIDSSLRAIASAMNAEAYKYGHEVGWRGVGPKSIWRSVEKDIVTALQIPEMVKCQESCGHCYFSKIPSSRKEIYEALSGPCVT